METIDVTIPADIGPLERGELFEEPIEDALQEAGVEFEYVGGGTSIGGEPSCDFAFEVSDLKLALSVFIAVLKQNGAPPDTTILAGDDEKTYRLGDFA